MPTRDQILLRLNMEIEKLECRLAGYQDRTLRGERHWPSFNRTIEQKQRLIAERDRLLRMPPATPARRESEGGEPETALADACRVAHQHPEVIYALIEDATTDTVLWLQADPPAEERVYVLDIQRGIANLARIIERRIERRGLPEDIRQWPQTVAEVLSGLEKAREVRGNIVGKCLARLPERLPMELPNPRVSQAPSPGRRLPGTWTPIRQEPTVVPPNPPTYFPLDLWPRARVILCAAIETFPSRKRMPELCNFVISRMTPLYCEAVKNGMMEAGAVLREHLGGMLDLLRLLLVYNDDHPSSGGLSNEAYEIYVKAANSDEWRELEKATTNVEAEAQRTRKQSLADHIGKNIDRLRNECGWSFAKLAKKTGIDKKLILSHVNRGAKPHPKTMKEYAQAFAKELNRPITANDLKE